MSVLEDIFCEPIYVGDLIADAVLNVKKDEGKCLQCGRKCQSPVHPGPCAGPGGDEPSNGRQPSRQNPDASPSASSGTVAEALPEAAKGKLAKLRAAVAGAASAAVHPVASVRAAGRWAKDKIGGLQKQYGTAGTVAILGAAILATPIPLPGSSAIAFAGVKMLLNVMGVGKAAQKSMKADLSEQQAGRLGKAFVVGFLARCGLSPDLKPLKRDKAYRWIKCQTPLHPGPCAGPGGDSPSSSKPSGDKPEAITYRDPHDKPDNPEHIESPVRFGAAEQRHAEGMQERLASEWKGAKAIPGNAPSDVEHVSKCCRQQVEMKTLLSNKRGRVRMSSAAMARKMVRLAEEPPPTRRLWTVAYDHRESYATGNLGEATTFPLYIREGAGSFAVKSMHRVESAKELERLMATPAEKLPDAAKPPVTGFYADWQAASPRKREQMAKRAFRSEKAAEARSKARHEARERT